MVEKVINLSQRKHPKDRHGAPHWYEEFITHDHKRKNPLMNKTGTTEASLTLMMLWNNDKTKTELPKTNNEG